MAKRPNILIICSDEHHPGHAGYRGHPHVETPVLDRLAAGGAAFTRAYCTSPICTPSRMSFISGKYVHQIDNWMIGFPLPPDEMTWARRLDQAGIRSTMLGKLDFCGDYQDGGFSDHKILRRRGAFKEIPLAEPFKARLPGYTRPDKRVHVRKAGGRSSEVISDGGFVGEGNDEIGNFDHDRIVTDWALDYLRDAGSRGAGSGDDAPWALYVGLLMPHWPFRVPTPYFERYYPDRVDLPFDYEIPNPRLHPALQRFQSGLDLGEIPHDDLLKTLAAYSGMVSCLDEMIGEIVGELQNQGLADDTIVIYTSDHGESLGEHGLFYKQCSYEGSAGVPLIVSGPGIPPGQTISSPVDLVDLYPTILDIADLPVESDRPGRSWMEMIGWVRPDGQGTRAGRPGDGTAPAARPNEARRTRPDSVAFSEFHANFFTNDWYLVAGEQYKYTYYVGESPTLFDIVEDPQEMRDLAGDPAFRTVVAEMESVLRSIVDPDATAERAKRALGLIAQDGTDLTVGR